VKEGEITIECEEDGEVSEVGEEGKKGKDAGVLNKKKTNERKRETPNK